MQRRFGILRSETEAHYLYVGCTACHLTGLFGYSRRSNLHLYSTELAYHRLEACTTHRLHLAVTLQIYRKCTIIRRTLNGIVIHFAAINLQCVEETVFIDRSSIVDRKDIGSTPLCSRLGVEDMYIVHIQLYLLTGVSRHESNRTLKALAYVAVHAAIVIEGCFAVDSYHLVGIIYH